MSLGVHVAELCGMVVLVVIAILWNAFNLAVTIQHQWKTGGHQPIGMIISCISVSNMLQQISMLAVLLIVWADMLFSVKCLPVLRASFFIWIQSNCMSFWSIAWLSVYFCVKIIGASNTLLCKLKRKISSFINMALLLTALCSFVACLPLLSLHPSSLNGTAPNETQNATGTSLKIILLPWMDTNLYVYVLMGFLCPVPVLIMLPTSLRLVAHLCHHTLAMKKNNNQFQGTDSYLLVCKLTVSMVGVYLTTVTIVFLSLRSWSPGRFPFAAFAWDLDFFCLATGILLTLLNKQTKEKLALLLGKCLDAFKGVSHRDSSNTEISRQSL